MRKLLFTTAVLFVLSSLALAQDQPLSGAEEGPLLQEDEEVVEVPKTQQEQVAAGRSIVKRGTILSKRVRHALNGARKDNDILMVTCLNDKLTQINANLKSAKERLENLGAAVEPGQAAHEYKVLTVIGEKLTVLDREAAQCAGQEMFDTGATKVITEIDTSMLPFEDRPGFPPEILPPGLPTFPPPASGRR
ncbi:MAG: hypothetical protein OXT09_28355 [Myxococcales bacterium]|nr:hypothetical protein [Myxococcales bacterium]